MSHSHPHLPGSTTGHIQRLKLSLAITLILVIVEVVAGVYADSLALLTDAAHNFTDVLALVLTAWALSMTERPAHAGKTYGYHRAGILVALVNSTTLALIALGIFYEAFRRFMSPPTVQAEVLISVGAAAVVVNLLTALLIRRGAEHDLNLKSAFQHLLGDVLSTVGAVVAGILIRFTGREWIDPLVSVLIGLLILWNAWGIIRESVDILMESTPVDVDMESLRRDVLAVTGVCGVHDLHVWSITSQLRYLSAHIVTEDISVSEAAKVQAAVRRMLSERHSIKHVTLQLECEACVSPEQSCDIQSKPPD